MQQVNLFISVEQAFTVGTEPITPSVCEFWQNDMAYLHQHEGFRSSYAIYFWKFKPPLGALGGFTRKRIRNQQKKCRHIRKVIMIFLFLDLEHYSTERLKTSIPRFAATSSMSSYLLL